MIQSTGQADLRQALPIGSALTGRNQTFGVKPTILTGPLVDSICAARLCASMAVDEKDRNAPEGLDEHALRDIDDFCTLTDATMQSVLAQGPASPRWAELVPVILAWPAHGGGPTLSDLTTVYRAHKAPCCAERHLGALMNAWALFIEHCGDIQLDSVAPAPNDWCRRGRLPAARSATRNPNRSSLHENAAPGSRCSTPRAIGCPWVH